MIRAGTFSTPRANAGLAPRGRRVRLSVWLAALSAGLLVATAAPAATPATAGNAAKAKAKQRFSFETPLLPLQTSPSDIGRFSFTAPGSGAARLSSVEQVFRFTPSGQSDNRRALSLGVATRVTAPSNDRSRAAAPAETLAGLPTSYNVDLSVAWNGFAVNTGYSRAEAGPLALLPGGGRRDSVDLGLSYRGRNWKTSLLGTAEEGSLLPLAPLERRYSVELGGAYAVAPRFSVTGGVRYKLPPVSPSLLETDRGDQAVYLGTNIAF